MENLTEEQGARRLVLLPLIAAALPAIIALQSPMDTESTAEGVRRFAPEQITEIAYAAYEIAEVVIQVVEAAEAAERGETESKATN